MNFLPNSLATYVVCVASVALSVCDVHPAIAKATALTGLPVHEQPAPKAEPGKPTRHVVLARNTSTPVASAEKTEPTAGQPASAKSPHKKAAHHWKSLIESIREITHAHHKR